MKAIQIHEFGGVEKLKLEEVTLPPPAASQVSVRVKAIGVNPVDTYIRSGKYGPRPFPWCPGFDAAGEIDAVGPGVTHWKKGDRVWVYGSVTGAYAESLICAETQVHPLPTHLDFKQGAAIGVPYITAAYALCVRTQTKPGETVLIHGASGGVGTAAIQLAKSLGLTVFGTASTEKGRQLVKSQGADHVLDHSAPDYFGTLLKLTQDKGVDLILEMLANVNLSKDLKVLAKNGRVVVIGNRGTIEIDPREAMQRNASILGMSILNATAFELASVSARLEKALDEKVLIPVVGKKFSLSEAAKAQEAILSPGSYGKIVLVP